MYTLTALARLSRDDASFLLQHKDTEALMHAIAKAVADALPLLSHPVEDPEREFKVTLFPKASSAINFFNSVKVFDVKKTMELCKIFWLVRYHLVFPADTTYIGYSDEKINQTHFFGYGYYVPAETLEYCFQNGYLLAGTLNKIAKIITTNDLVK